MFWKTPTSGMQKKGRSHTPPGALLRSFSVCRSLPLLMPLAPSLFSMSSGWTPWLQKILYSLRH